MRDLRDPQALGTVLRHLVRNQKVPVLVAADELDAYAVKDYPSNEGPVERYGKPGEIEPHWERIQIR